MPEKNEFRTDNLGLLFQFASNAAPTLARDARKELQALKLLAAKKFIDNYCEYYGVPKEVVGATDEQLIEWATQQHQKDLENSEGSQVPTWP
jgi:hypothetical protein